MRQYDHKKIEKKWQRVWKQTGLYKTKEPKDVRSFGGETTPALARTNFAEQNLRGLADSGTPFIKGDFAEHGQPSNVKGQRSYVLDMFPYISGEGLHVGHPKGYIATDVYSRMKRMQGHAILHPMGWDAFGLPAENYAIKNKVHPGITVKKNISRFKRQLEILGFNYDWEREINTTDPNYYKWTQWIFLQMFHHGLAYRSNEPINWCPSCKTGLANEDLEDGKCERCGSTVEKRPIPQWVLKITDYADRMLADLDKLNWPESIKESQRNWIGRSEGAEIGFKIQDSRFKKEIGEIAVFTTRADTLFGATYLVLAPENPFIKQIQDSGFKIQEEVTRYIQESRQKSEIERTAEGKEKTGVELKGIKAVNPANGEEIPIFAADYVLAEYGTGAIMAVPAHDERDFEFAKKYNLPVREVVVRMFGKKSEGAIRRDSVAAVITRQSDEKILILYNRKTNEYEIPGGGKLDDEKESDTLKREVIEESGYTDFEIKEDLGQIQENFFAVGRNENRVKFQKGYHVVLLNENTTELKQDEHEDFERLWADSDEAVRKLDSNKNISDESEFIKRFLNQKLKCFTGRGIIVNSGKFDGMSSDEAKSTITETVGGKMVTKYKLRDWVFSRQRYWGEPIPLVFCEACKIQAETTVNHSPLTVNSQKLKVKSSGFSLGERLNPGWIGVPENKLPVKLPNVKSYEPTGTGESPLADIARFVNTKCPKCGGPAKRETNTMPQWAGSCWYYLAYLMQDKSKVKGQRSKVSLKSSRRAFERWLPVDLYVGGAEHATRHLIYARFWHKFLYDIGVVATNEPFQRLHNVGLIQASDGRKMSKRCGNVINPDDIVKRFGADSLRIYEMFMGPFNQAIAWNTDGLVGARRFIERVWRLQEKMSSLKIKDEGLRIKPLLHQTIKKVGDDIDCFRFNTAISALMILANALEKETVISKMDFEILIKLLSPFAPHIAEELYETLGRKNSIHSSDWPIFDEKLARGERITIVVQINGRTRNTFEAKRGLSDEELQRHTLSLPTVQKWTNGKEIRKVITVKDRLVNIVI